MESAALVGGALGAVAGGLIGHSMDQEAQARLRQQAPQTYARLDQGQPLGLADVKALAEAKVNDGYQPDPQLAHRLPPQQR